MKLLKKGDKGPDVVNLQQKLKITADGIFGPQTEKAVIRFQLHRGLKPDGIVGIKTWGELIMSTNVSITEAIDEDTDTSGQYFTTPYNQTIHRHYLSTSEYLAKPLPIEYCFLHHTAGRENPYKVVDHWD